MNVIQQLVVASFVFISVGQSTQLYSMKATTDQATQTESIKEIGSCAICLENVKEHETTAKLPCCKQSLHSTCLSDLVYRAGLEKKKEVHCPFCKQAIITTPQANDDKVIVMTITIQFNNLFTHQFIVLSKRKTVVNTETFQKIFNDIQKQTMRYLVQDVGVTPIQTISLNRIEDDISLEDKDTQIINVFVGFSFEKFTAEHLAKIQRGALTTILTLDCQLSLKMY